MRLLIFCLWLCSIPLGAQTPWSLDECIRFGIEQNLALKNKHLDTRIAKEEYIRSIGDFLPEVTTSGDLGKRFGRSVNPKTNLYTNTSFVESNLGLNISLPLFEGFTRINRLKFSRLNQRISKLNARVKENEIAYEVMDAFYQLSFEERMLRLAVEQRKLSERYMEQTEEYLTLGLRSLSDRQEMKARLQSDIYQEKVRENNCRMSLLRLKELLNLTASDSLRIAYASNDTILPPTEHLPAQEVYRLSENVLPEFRAMQLQQQASRKSVALAAAKFSPSVRAEFGWRTGYYNTEKNEQGLTIPLGDQLRNNENKYIGISVSFPLFTGLSRFTEVRKERLKMKQTDNEGANLALTIQADVEDACQSLRAAAVEHNQAMEQWKAEALSLRENEEKWAEGLISVFELMEKRNRYMSAKAELARTRLQYDIKYRTIEFYRTGSFLPVGISAAAAAGSLVPSQPAAAGSNAAQPDAGSLRTTDENIATAGSSECPLHGSAKTNNDSN